MSGHGVEATVAACLIDGPHGAGGGLKHQTDDEPEDPDGEAARTAQLDFLDADKRPAPAASRRAVSRVAPAAKLTAPRIVKRKLMNYQPGTSERQQKRPNRIVTENTR